MADKRHIRQGISWLQRVKTWQLLLLLVVIGLVAATFLRLNNIGMIERRTAVFSADEQGDSEVIRARLFDLQRYAGSHMNADTGDIYLEAQYRRNTEAAILAASATDPASNINVQADAACKAQYAGYSQAYVQCFANELAKVPEGSTAQQKANLPSPNLYKYDFSSPAWSADFAGFSLLICFILVFLIVSRLIGLAILQLLVRRHYSHV